MRVIGQLKDGTTFTYNDIMRIDDHEGVIIVHNRDGSPRSMRREEIEYMNVNFLLPKPKIFPSRQGGRKLSLE